MGSASVGVQCPLTSSLGEFPGYWDWLWCPTPFPSPSTSGCFPFTLLHLPLDFISLFFTAALSGHRHHPSFCTRAWDGTGPQWTPRRSFIYIHTHIMHT